MVLNKNRESIFNYLKFIIKLVLWYNNFNLVKIEKEKIEFR